MRLTSAAAILSIQLPGYAAVPTAILRIGLLDKRDIRGIDPQGVRLRILLPMGYELDFRSTMLIVDITSNSNGFIDVFELEEVTTRDTSIEDGLLEPPTGKFREYLLRLSQQSRSTLGTVKLLAELPGEKQGRLDVFFSLDPVPEGADRVILTVDLQLSQAQGFVRLFDQAEIAFSEISKAARDGDRAR